MDELTAQKYPGKRLHVRAIIRDGARAFIGSQSLRGLELDRRREIGVFLSEKAAVRKMAAVFEEDWARTPAAQAQAKAKADAEVEPAKSSEAALVSA